MTESLIEYAQNHIEKHPHILIQKLEWEGETVWLKRRPFSKKTHWHRAQGFLAQWVKLPTFAPTATAGGPESLFHEANRFQQFRENNIPVPKVMAVNSCFLITEDVGIQLQHHLQTLTPFNESKQLLNKAVLTIQKMHQANLCHGRPSLRDMTFKNEAISFIDLEENPLLVMSLPQAQARDIWLFLNSAARFCKNDPMLLMDLFSTYQSNICDVTLHELKKMVRQLKPIRRLLDGPLVTKLGRDVQCAVSANKALEHFL